MASSIKIYRPSVNYNFSCHLRRWASIDPTREAIRFEANRWSYDDLNKAVNETAWFLSNSGIVRGDRVAILAMNSDEYVIACLAIARLGAVSVLLNYRLALEELRYLIEDCEPVAILLDADFITVQKNLENLIVDLRCTCILYSEDKDVETLSTLRVSSRGKIFEDVILDGDDLDRIMYTSGTTSRPKGVMLSHGNATWNLFTQILEGCNSPDERTLIFAPLHHIGAQELPGLRVFGVGGLMVIMRRFDARSVLAAIEEHQITGMVIVSTMIHIMRDLPDRHNFDTTSLRWLVFGQVPESMLEEIQLIFPQAYLKNSYGLTETCSTVTSIDPISQIKNTTSPGRVVPTLELDIVDDNDFSVRPREVGEIVVRGPKTMLGYWRQEEATAETMKNGWLHTGDVGWRDEDGLLFIVDRKKDMIRTGGENVASQEVERVIYGIKWVAEVAVVGIPDKKWGERIRAIIVPRPGMTGSADEVLLHCSSQLAAFKVPKDIEFREELPRNPSGKILKAELRSQI